MVVAPVWHGTAKVRQGALIVLHELPHPDVYPDTGAELWDLIEGRSAGGAEILGELLRQTPKSLLVVLAGRPHPDAAIESACCSSDRPMRRANPSTAWLVRYLTGRYFRLPENVKLQARVLTRDVERWPDQEPDPAEKTFNLQTIRGLKALLDQKAVHRGTVTLATADALWWLFDDPAQSSKEMSTRGGRTGVAGVVFQDEVYVYRPRRHRVGSLPALASCSAPSTSPSSSNHVRAAA